jgi:hypothetical protein
VAEGAHASHANCASSSTDNAARATSAELKRLKGVEIDEVKRLIEEHIPIPAKMAHAVKCWQKLNPAQQEDAYEMHELGCSGHSVNLTTDDSHKHSETKAMADNMVRERAARIMQRNFLAKFVPSRLRLVLKGYVGTRPAFQSGFVQGSASKSDMALVPSGKHLNGSDVISASETLHQVSKLLSAEGEHFDYYLNEYRSFALFAKRRGIKVWALLSNKGSRQNYSVQQPTRVLANASGYTQYFHETRIDSDPNKLVDAVWDGLRDRFLLGAFRARSFVDAAFASPLIFFTHSELVVFFTGMIAAMHLLI